MEFRIEFVILNKNHVTKLSVNINKIATIRNARGGQTPNVVQFAIDCQTFGADGITVHPRPDERHITYKDTLEISQVITTEFNIEGYPDARYFELLKKTKPAQATLVPDGPTVLTSNAGWDVKANETALAQWIYEIKLVTFELEGNQNNIFILLLYYTIIGISSFFLVINNNIFILSYLLFLFCLFISINLY